MKRVLICGSNGLLGQRLALNLSARTDIEVLNTGRQRSFVFDDHLFDYTQLDVTHRSDVKSLVASFQPTTIINAVAAVDVDWCEDHREEAWKINAEAVEHLVEAARKVRAHVIHYSTDYVFDGMNGPYDELNKPNPVNYYGKTKLAAENIILSAGIRAAILRVSLLFGTGVAVKGNFGLKVVKGLREGQRIRATEEIGTNPTHCSDGAAAGVAALEREVEGIFHVCGAEFATRRAFARILASTFGLSDDLIDLVSISDLKLPAIRPRNTGFVWEKARRDLQYSPMSLRAAAELFKRELYQHPVN